MLKTNKNINQGEKRFILKSEFAKQLGIPEQAKDMIELYYDENGEQKMRLKDGAKKLNIGNETEYIDI